MFLLNDGTIQSVDPDDCFSDGVAENDVFGHDEQIKIVAGNNNEDKADISISSSNTSRYMFDFGVTEASSRDDPSCHLVSGDELENIFSGAYLTQPRPGKTNYFYHYYPLIIMTHHDS